MGVKKLDKLVEYFDFTYSEKNTVDSCVETRTKLVTKNMKTSHIMEPELTILRSLVLVDTPRQYTILVEEKG